MRTSYFAAVAVVAAALTPAAHADDGWSFKNVSLNYLDWTGRTERNTEPGPFGQKKDFPYLEAEGGMGGNWGDLYGFFDIENPNKGTHEPEVGKSRRYAWKVVGRINVGKIGDMPVQMYAHIYDFTEGDFNDQNRVLGLGTSWSSGNFWVKPFLGVHDESKSGVGAHFNGGMGGWVWGYSFNAFGQSFMATNWHEWEFARKAEYLVMARDGEVVQGRNWAQNGAVSLWWNVTKNFTTGVTYRYAYQKLGSATYEDGLIYTARWNF